MQFYGLNELREKYLSFFEGKGHLRLPSFRLFLRMIKHFINQCRYDSFKTILYRRTNTSEKRVTTCQNA